MAAVYRIGFFDEGFRERISQTDANDMLTKIVSEDSYAQSEGLDGTLRLLGYERISDNLYIRHSEDASRFVVRYNEGPSIDFIVSGLYLGDVKDLNSDLDTIISIKKKNEKSLIGKLIIHWISNKADELMRDATKLSANARKYLFGEDATGQISREYDALFRKAMTRRISY